MDTITRNFKSLSGAPRELWLTFLLNIIESYGYFSMSMILTLYLSNEFGMSDLAAGTAYGMYGCMCTLFGFGVGFLIDNMGVKVSLVFGFFLLFLARFLLAITDSMWVLKLCLYCLFPLGSSFGIPVMSMGIKRYTNQTNRGFAFGLFYATMNVAALLSGIVVDALDIGLKDGLEIFGHHFTSKRLILLTGAATTLLSLVLSLFLREIKVSEDDEESGGAVKTHVVERASPVTIVKELLAMPMFWKFLAITLICVNLKCIFRYLDALLPKYLIREFGENVPKGSINAINPAMIILLVPIVSAFTSDVRPYRMIEFGAYITAASVLPLCFMTQISSAVMFVSILSFGEAFWSPRFFDLTVSMAPEGREGTFAAMGSAPIFLAKLPVGVLSGWLLQEYCPKEGERNSMMMWWIIFLITMPAPFLLTGFRSCLGSTGQEEDPKAMKMVNSSSSGSDMNPEESDESTDADEGSSHDSDA